MVVVSDVILDARVYPSIDVVALNAELDFFKVEDVNGNILVSQTATIVSSTSLEVSAIRISQCSSIVLSGTVSEFQFENIQLSLTAVAQGKFSDQ